MIVNISLAMKNAELNCSQTTNGDINNCIKSDIHFVQQNSSIHIIIYFLANISALILPRIKLALKVGDLHIKE